MPKIARYRLTWSFTDQTYQLQETRDHTRLHIVPESLAWFAWLDQISSFAFWGEGGHYTARKEKRPRGEAYWYAYVGAGKKLAKKYLGKTADVTLARLEQVATELQTAAAGVENTLHDAPSVPESMMVKAPPVVAREAASRGMTEQGPHRTELSFQRDRLLMTKLHQPRPRSRLVSRSHLIQRIQQGMEHALTLVSAPAGFGKTTLLAQWLAESNMPVAWLSVDAEDNDPTRFLTYLIAALQRLYAQVGTTALALLRTPQPPSPEAVLAILANDLVSCQTQDVALVLDDYHLILSESIQRGMTFLLEHQPPYLHLILATRADPPLLPLARLRAQGQLCEVRAADLRFSPTEASAFLQDVMGLKLPLEAMVTLEIRTEGWIAGLQLAALSLQDRTDIAEFLTAFTGSHRYVLDYLSDEVLSRQPAQVQQFLLHTCILERLSGPLCDAETEQEGSQGMLEALERANLFVVPLDEERGWYRYHHLFADVLRRHLQQREPTLMPTLHRRASAWYEQHALPIQAVQHALAVPDFERAAHLIESIVFFPVAFQGQLSTVLEWLNILPQAQVRARPFLCVYYARLLIFTNQFQAAEELLQQTERRIQELPNEQAQTLQGLVLSIRAGIAGFSGDIPQAVSLARHALELLPEAEVIPRQGANITASRAYEVSGDVTPTAEHTLAVVVTSIRITDNIIGAVSSICQLAQLHVLQGRLRQAAVTYAQVVQVIPQPEVLHTFFTSFYYYFGLGDLLREWNELEVAERHLVQGMALLNESLTVEPFVAVLGYTALARLQQARGNSSAVFATLNALADLAEQRHFSAHLLAQVAAVRAQLEMAQNNLAAAIGWADASGLSPDDEELPYPLEGEYLVLARVRIAEAREDSVAPFLQDVLHLLDRLLWDAEAKARGGSVLEILVLRALALETQGNRTLALSTLEQALLLAEPEGYIRLFVDEGEPMLALLRQAQARSRVPGYVATLLSAFGERSHSDLPPTFARPGPLVEPLTQREREVLRLLLEGASNREIAQRLVVSVNTVKRHVYNLCGKLGVQSRTQAIARARSLNLL